jgi:hypothetical protein
MRRVFFLRKYQKELAIRAFPRYPFPVSDTTTAQAKRREEYSEKFAAVNAGEITEQEWMEYCSMVLQDIFDEEEQ